MEAGSGEEKDLPVFWQHGIASKVRVRDEGGEDLEGDGWAEGQRSKNLTVVRRYHQKLARMVFENVYRQLVCVGVRVR